MVANFEAKSSGDPGIDFSMHLLSNYKRLFCMCSLLIHYIHVLNRTSKRFRPCDKKMWRSSQGALYSATASSSSSSSSVLLSSYLLLL